MVQGLRLPGPPIRQQQVTMLAQPMNDIQATALVAAACPGTAAERVTLAIDIVEQIMLRQFEMSNRIGNADLTAKKAEGERQKAEQAEQEKAPQGILVGV